MLPRRTLLAASARGSVGDGRVKGLAISSKRRLSPVPDLPTFAEAGAPGYQAFTWHMVPAPADRPQAIVTRLHWMVNESVAVPEVRNRLRELTGAEITDSTPDGDRAFLIAARDAWGKEIREAGITVN
jgi:tripartite-type tricarboxylate transporter receptor subunit TctC